MLNAIGLQNIGVERFVNEVAPRLTDGGAVYVREHLRPHDRGVRGGGRRLSEVPALAAIELNASCPNVKEGGSPSVRTPRGCPVSPGGCVPPREAVVGKALPERVGHRRDRAGRPRRRGRTRVTAHQHHRRDGGGPRTRRPILSNVTGAFSGPR